MYKIIGVDQKEYGPISIEQMRQWFSEGRVNGQTMVWSDTSNNWKPFASYPEFADLTPSVPPPLNMPPQGMPGEKIPNYLVQSILCTLCCCLPFGIVAIVYAAQVNGKVQAGDYMGARESSAKAKKWCWIALGAGIVAAIVQLALLSGRIGEILSGMK